MVMKIIDLAFQGPQTTKVLDAMDRSKLELSRSWSKAFVVPENTSAKQVAEMVGLNDMEIIVVVDKKNAVKGIVAPNVVTERAVQELNLTSKPKDFVGTVVEVIKRQKSNKAGFEWLNYARPELYWCDKGNHFTIRKPCPEHPA